MVHIRYLTWVKGVNGETYILSIYNILKYNGYSSISDFLKIGSIQCSHVIVEKTYKYVNKTNSYFMGTVFIKHFGYNTIFRLTKFHGIIITIYLSIAALLHINWSKLFAMQNSLNDPFRLHTRSLKQLGSTNHETKWIYKSIVYA